MDNGPEMTANALCAGAAWAGRRTRIPLAEPVG
jgi:hypothetical protein